MMRQLGVIADEVVEKLRRQMLVRRIHLLGPRPVAELVEELFELVPPIFHSEIQQRLERYAELDAATVLALGANRLSSPPLHAVSSR